MNVAETHDLPGWAARTERSTSADGWKQVMQLPTLAEKGEFQTIQTCLMAHMQNRMGDVMDILGKDVPKSTIMVQKYLTQPGVIHSENVLEGVMQHLHQSRVIPQTESELLFLQSLVRQHLECLAYVEFFKNPDLPHFPEAQTEIQRRSTVTPSPKRSAREWVEYVLDQTVFSREKFLQWSSRYKTLFTRKISVILQMLNKFTPVLALLRRTSVSPGDTSRIQLGSIGSSLAAREFLVAALKERDGATRVFYLSLVKARSDATQRQIDIAVAEKDPFLGPKLKNSFSMAFEEPEEQ